MDEPRPMDDPRPRPEPVGARPEVPAARVTVAILGQEHTFRTRSDPERVRAAAARVDEHLRRVAEANPTLGTMRAAVLALMQLMDEVMRLEEQQAQMAAALEEEWSRRARSPKTTA